MQKKSDEKEKLTGRLTDWDNWRGGIICEMEMTNRNNKMMIMIMIMMVSYNIDMRKLKYELMLVAAVALMSNKSNEKL